MKRRHGIRCPKCGEPLTKVIRVQTGGGETTRERRCSHGHRIRTVERVFLEICATYSSDPEILVEQTSPVATVSDGDGI